MKGPTFFSFILLITISFVFAQLGVNTDGSLPDGPAILDVKSNNKGFLPSQLTRVEMNAIPNPANGRTIYCIGCRPDEIGTLSMFIAGFWFSLNSTYYVGDYATNSFGTVYGNELILQLNPSQSPYFNFFRCSDVQEAGMFSYQIVDPVSKATNNNVGTVTVLFAKWGPLANLAFKSDITIPDQSGTITKIEILNGAIVLDTKLGGSTAGSFTISKSSSYTSLTL